MSLDAKSFCSSVNQSSYDYRISQLQHFWPVQLLSFWSQSLCWWCLQKDWNANPFGSTRVELRGAKVDSLLFHSQYIHFKSISNNHVQDVWRRKARAVLPLLSCYGMHESRKGSDGIKTCRPMFHQQCHTQYERVNPHNIPSCILRMYPSISYDRYHVISLITSYRSRVIHIISHHGICSHVISCHVVSQYTISFKLLPSPPPKPYVIGHAAIYQALNPGTRIVMILTLYSFWCLICIFAKQN